jgi:hypothetical protein
MADRRRTLVRRRTVVLPPRGQAIQWPHPGRRFGHVCRRHIRRHTCRPPPGCGEAAGRGRMTRELLQGNRIWVLRPLCCRHSRASGNAGRVTGFGALDSSFRGNDRGEKGNSLAKCDCPGNCSGTGLRPFRCCRDTPPLISATDLRYLRTRQFPTGRKHLGISLGFELT